MKKGQSVISLIFKNGGEIYTLVHYQQFIQCSPPNKSVCHTRHSEMPSQNISKTKTWMKEETVHKSSTIQKAAKLPYAEHLCSLPTKQRNRRKHDNSSRSAGKESMHPGYHFGEDIRGEGFFDFFVFRYSSSPTVLEQMVQTGFCLDDIDIRILGNRY